MKGMFQECRSKSYWRHAQGKRPLQNFAGNPESAAQGMPQVASVLFGASAKTSAPQSVWGCLDLGWRDDTGFWVHPACSDAAIHLAAASEKQARVLMSVGHFSTACRLHGRHFSAVSSCKSAF